MRHPSEGTLRRLLDEPIGVADTDYEHVRGCATCGAALTAAQDDAAFAATALAVDSEVDLDDAWERFSHALARSALTDWLSRWPSGDWRRAWQAAFPRPFAELVHRLLLA